MLRSKISDLFGLLMVLLILIALGGFAWFTRNPESPLLDQASSWPIAGPFVEKFRQAYLPPPPDEISEGGIEIEWRVEEPEAEAWIAPPVDALDYVWVEPGSILRQEPSNNSKVLEKIEVYANAQKLDQQGDWYRIWRQGRIGWVYLEGYAARQAQGEPPLGNQPEPPRPLEPTPPDPIKLEKALGIFGEDVTEGFLGPYLLYTDSERTQLLEFLDTVAAQVESTYQDRYGLRPLGKPQAALVLYEKEGAYRLLQAKSDRLVGLHSLGHATSGMAAFFVGNRGRNEIAGTLIHELVHLINRRALGPALPPWLDEGLADDLALSRIDSDGRLDPSSLSSRRQRDGTRVTFHGGAASLLQLRDRLRRNYLMPLEELTETDWETFVRGSQGRALYAQSTFWIRFLQNAHQGRYRQPFQAYLAGIAAGESASGETLRRHLDEEWKVLDASFRAWLEFAAMSVQ